jgi:hypothetical protein
MTNLDLYIYIVIAIKILFITVTVTHKLAIISDKNKELINLTSYLKERLELLFKLLMSIFLIYMFYPGRKPPIPLDFEARLLLYLFGFIIIITADWKSIYSHSVLNKNTRKEEEYN